MCKKFLYDRLRNDRALGNGKSDNNNKKNVRSHRGPVSRSRNHVILMPPCPIYRGTDWPTSLFSLTHSTIAADAVVYSPQIAAEKSLAANRRRAIKKRPRRHEAVNHKTLGSASRNSVVCAEPRRSYGRKSIYRRTLSDDVTALAADTIYQKQMGSCRSCCCGGC